MIALLLLFSNYPEIAEKKQRFAKTKIETIAQLKIVHNHRLAGTETVLFYDE